MVHVPKPTSLVRMDVPGNMRYFTLMLLLEHARRLAREVCDDDARAGAADGNQRIHHDSIAVDPAALRGRLNHTVLATHLVRGERIARFLTHSRDDIEERSGWLHHHH